MVTLKTSVRVPTRKGAWRDPRFILGVVLVALSVLACTYVVSWARAGHDLYQTTKPVAAGDALDASNTRIVQARPESDAYLSAGDLLEGSTAMRSLGQGELIPSGAVSTADQATRRRLVIAVSQGLSDALTPGAPLELWFVPSSRNTVSTDPVLITDDVTLVAIPQTTTGIGSSGATRIEIRVSIDDLPRVLESTAAEGTLAAVPVGG